LATRLCDILGDSSSNILGDSSSNILDFGDGDVLGDILDFNSGDVFLDELWDDLFNPYGDILGVGDILGDDYRWLVLAPLQLTLVTLEQTHIAFHAALAEVLELTIALAAF
jgi:hypothetical protein